MEEMEKTIELFKQIDFIGSSSAPYFMDGVNKMIDACREYCNKKGDSYFECCSLMVDSWNLEKNKWQDYRVWKEGITWKKLTEKEYKNHLINRDNDWQYRLRYFPDFKDHSDRDKSLLEYIVSELMYVFREEEERTKDN